jgi:hypothetical protein
VVIARVQTDEHRCDECGYRLRGLTVTRCPECGTEFDPRAAPQADIPWLRRGELGVTSAYVQTVTMILIQPRRFAAELCRPVRVSAEDAYEFRLLSIFISSVSVLLALAAYLRDPLSLWPMRVVPMLAMAWVVIAAGLRLASDLPTFIWGGLPRRASQLSPLHQYACAPLALLPLVAAPWVLGLMIFEADMVDSGGQITPAAWLFVAALLVPIVVLAWLIPVRFMDAATHNRERVTLLAVYLPIHWLIVLGMVGLVVFTAMYFGLDALI